MAGQEDSEPEAEIAQESSIEPEEPDEPLPGRVFRFRRFRLSVGL